MLLRLNLGLLVSVCLSMGSVALAQNKKMDALKSYGKSLPAPKAPAAAAAAAPAKTEGGESKGLGPHEHGTAALRCGLQTKKLQCELHGPGESFYGFEREAASDEDKRKQEEAFTKIKTEFLKYFATPAESKCKISTASAQAHSTNKMKVASKKVGNLVGEHAELDAKVTIDCEADVAGKTVAVDFKQGFPGLKKLKVTIMTTKPKSVTLNDAKGSVTL